MVCPGKVFLVDGASFGFPRGDQLEDGLAAAPPPHFCRQRSFDGEFHTAIERNEFGERCFHLIVQIDCGLGCHTALKGDAGIALLEQWLRWARRCRIPSFVKLAKAITAHRTGIEAALTHGLSNARVERLNPKLRLLTRIAFGFRSPDALITLAMLDLGAIQFS